MRAFRQEGWGWSRCGPSQAGARLVGVCWVLLAVGFAFSVWCCAGREERRMW